MARPRSYDDTLRAALLEEAARTIAEGGVEGLVMRRLAASVGTSTSAIYSLFGGKPALIEAVVDQAVDSLTASMRGVAPSSDPQDDLLAIGTAYRSWALDHRDLYAVMFGSQMVPVPGRETTVQSLMQIGLGPLVASLTRLREQGRLREADLFTVAGSLWSSMHGIVDLEHGILAHLLPVPTRDAIFRAHMAAMTRGWVLDPDASEARTAEPESGVDGAGVDRARVDGASASSR